MCRWCACRARRAGECLRMICGKISRQQLRHAYSPELPCSSGDCIEVASSLNPCTCMDLYTRGQHTFPLEVDNCDILPEYFILVASGWCITNWSVVQISKIRWNSNFSFYWRAKPKNMRRKNPSKLGLKWNTAKCVHNNPPQFQYSSRQSTISI